MKGFVQLHRKITDSWITEDPMALALWVRILVEATHKSRKVFYKGANYDLKPGDLLFGLNRWSEKTGISREVIRKRIDMMESDGMITRSKHPKISIVSITNWHDYQCANTVTTRKQHADNTLTTLSEHKYNNVNNENNEDNVKDIGKRKRFAPPQVQDVSSYFAEQGSTPQEAQKFVDFYESKGWMVGKSKMKDWKASARNWIRRNKSDDAKQSKDDYYSQLASEVYE